MWAAAYRSFMERVMGIGPTPSAWKAEVLPLNYTRNNTETFGTQYLSTLWWRGKDSNLRRLSRQIYSLIPLTAREPLQKYEGRILLKRQALVNFIYADKENSAFSTLTL